MATYHDLGVSPFINASGNITTLGGSLMDPEVLDAMREAGAAFVDLNELNGKAGEYLARRIGVEAAFISAGAASGMLLAAAACLTGTDAKRVQALPCTDGWKSEFVISRVDPHTYIHQSIEVCGGRLVRVGSETSVTAAEILSGIGPNTAAIVHFLGMQTEEQLREVIEGATKLGVPVVVDAAAQLPPRSNLTGLVAMGASLVVFSGGKGLRGPQCAGLVIGKKELVDAARLNASPYSAIGRGMKVGKEEILGLVTAVDLFLRGSDAEDSRLWEADASLVVDAVDGIVGVRAHVVRGEQPAHPTFAPRAYVDIPRERAEKVVQAMRSGNPSVVIRRVPSGILVDPMTLQPGEARVVAQRLKEVLDTCR